MLRSTMSVQPLPPRLLAPWCRHVPAVQHSPLSRMLTQPAVSRPRVCVGMDSSPAQEASGGELSPLCLLAGCCCSAWRAGAV
jgi:hypothetical protein